MCRLDFLLTILMLLLFSLNNAEDSQSNTQKDAWNINVTGSTPATKTGSTLTVFGVIALVVLFILGAAALYWINRKDTRPRQHETVEMEPLRKRESGVFMDDGVRLYSEKRLHEINESTPGEFQQVAVTAHPAETHYEGECPSSVEVADLKERRGSFKTSK